MNRTDHSEIIIIALDQYQYHEKENEICTSPSPQIDSSMQCNKKCWMNISSKSTLQGDMKAIKEVHCKWTHTDRHTKQEEEKCKIGPIYKKIILDENSYANAGMSSLAYYQKAMFFLSFSFCSFFVFWWILISLSLGLFSRHAFENHLQHAGAGRVNA